MSYSGFLDWKSNLHDKARHYMKQPIQPEQAQLQLRPLVAKGTARNHQSALKWALPDMQLEYSEPAQLNADYATWHMWSGGLYV